MKTHVASLSSLVCIAILSVPISICLAGSPGWEDVPAILHRIEMPLFPAREFNAAQFGATKGGGVDCRKAIMDAIAACAAAGGGRVLVPAGVYLCNGPIELKSNVNLHLEEGSTLLFGTNPDDYLVGDPANGGCVPVTWEGTRCYNYSPLVYAFQQTNIAITGKGTIDGQTGKGWAAWLKLQSPAQQKLREMGHSGVPVEERVFGKGSFLRPTLLSPTNAPMF